MAQGPILLDGPMPLDRALETLLERAPVAMAVLDRTGAVQRWNAAAERLLGWAAAELAGRTLPVPASEAAPEWPALLESAGRGRPPEPELPVCQADGTPRRLRLAFTPFRDGSDALAGALVTLAPAEPAAEPDELRHLHELSLRLSRTLDLQVVIDEVLAAVTQLRGDGMGVVMLHDAARRELRLAASVGFAPEYLALAQRLPAESGQRACGTAAAERRPVVVEDVETDPRFVPFRETARLGGYRSAYSLPLLSRQGEVLGTIATYGRQPGRPSERQLRLVELYAAQAAQAIENAQLYESLRRDVAERRRAEEAERAARAQAERAERRFTDLVNSLDAIVWEADAETWQFTFVSRRAEDILGYPVEQWLTEPGFWASRIHPEDRDWAVQYCLTCTRAARDHLFDYRAVAADGRNVWLRDIVRVITDEAGRPRTLSGVMIDITEQRRAEDALRESERQYRTLAEAVPQLVWTATPDGACDYLNGRWFEYTGLRDEALGFGWVGCIHPDDAARTEGAWQEAVRTGGPFDLEFRIRASDDSFRWFKSRGVPVRDSAGRVVKWFGTCTDIDDQKRAQETVQRVNMELERRVEERTAALRESYEQLEAFSYSVSHDLRAPIRAIQGYTELLLEDFGKGLPATGWEYADRITRATEHMDRLIHDLLAFSRLGRVELDLAPVSVEAAVRDAVAQLDAVLYERGARVVLDELPPLRALAHGPTLAQAVANLVSNAVKFVAPGVAPRVALRAERRPGGWVRLWVEDNGIGIAPEYHERIFGVFERLHGGHEYQGTGIGLAIVRKGVERMGGRVGLESAPGRGSRFWLDLPEAPFSAAAGSERESSPGA